MDGATGFATMISSLKSWAGQPFSSDMGLGRWALFTGLIIVLVVAWIMVLHDLKGEILS